MNTQIASLILARIRAADFPWLEKSAGLVRAISTKANKTGGKVDILPIAADVLGSADCEPSTIDHLLPDQRYRSVLFIECSEFPTRKDERIGQPSWTGRYRVVVWMDCSKVGGGAGCGDVAYENLVTTLDVPMFNSDPFRAVVFRVVGGGPSRGKDIFSRYTINEERSQYLHYPFDYFALDIQVDFVLPKGCEDQLAEDNVNCWVPDASEAGNPTPTCPPVRTCDTPEDGDVLTRVDGATVWAPPAGGGGGTSDHGALSGLGDDDHTQYHNNARGDARYDPLTHGRAQHDGNPLTSHEFGVYDVLEGRAERATGDDVATWLAGEFDALGAAAAAQAAAIASASSDATTKANAAQAAAIAAAASDATTKANAAQAAAIAASQPVDSDLTAIAALTTTAYGRALLELANAAAGRTAFGLGTAAVSNTGDFDAAGAAAAAQAASQPLDSDLTAIAALTTTAYGRDFLALADAAAGRTALGLGTLATQSGTFSGTSSGTNTGDQDLSAYQTIAALAGSVRSTVLTGLSLATSQVIAATDTVLQAFGYLQAQISALTTTVSGKLTAASNLSDLASAATARTNLNVIHAHRDTVGSGQTTTSTTLASITGLSLDIDANEHVSIHVRVLFEVSSTSGGIGLGINGSTAATYFAGHFVTTQGAGNFAKPITTYSATTNATTCPAANTVYYAEVHAELVNGASASTITPMVARGGSGTLTIRAASIEITRS